MRNEERSILMTGFKSIKGLNNGQLAEAYEELNIKQK